MAPRRRPTPHTSVSEYSSDPSSEVSLTREGTLSPSPEPIRKRKYKAMDPGNDKDRNSKSSKRPRSYRKDAGKEKRNYTPREQCLQFARWIPRGIDMFCILKDVFRIAPFVEKVQRLLHDDDTDAEDNHRACDAQLANISKDAQDQYLRTYNRILAGAPYLHELVRSGRKKSKELKDILVEAAVVAAGLPAKKGRKKR